MSKHEWTAEEVHGLVKEWPDDAKVDARYRPSDGKFVNVAKWVHGDGRISNNAAALMFTASGIEWLIDCHGVVRAAVVPKGHAVEVDGTIVQGPTLLHAVSEAIKHTQGKK